LSGISAGQSRSRKRTEREIRMAKKAPLNLTAIQQLAINKIVSVDTYKKLNTDLKPGEYPVEMLVKIAGKLTKGEKYPSEIHLGIDWCKLFAFTLSKVNGATVESIVKEFLAAADIPVEEIKAKAQVAVDDINGVAKTECAGKLTADLTCEIVDTLGVEVK
jgi:hypothetical protein